MERMLRLVNKILKEEGMEKNQAINAMKQEINNFVFNQEDKNSLKAILEMELIKLDEDKIWEYFTEKREYLKILIKILKKGDDRSD